MYVCFLFSCLNIVRKSVLRTFSNGIHIIFGFIVLVVHIAIVLALVLAFVIRVVSAIDDMLVLMSDVHVVPTGALSPFVLSDDSLIQLATGTDEAACGSIPIAAMTITQTAVPATLILIIRALVIRVVIRRIAAVVQLLRRLRQQRMLNSNVCAWLLCVDNQLFWME